MTAYLAFVDTFNEMMNDFVGSFGPEFPSMYLFTTLLVLF